MCAFHHDGLVFTDRKDAGLQLGKMLEKEYGDRHVLVLGIPRGGVEIGYYVAQALHAELDLLVSKKLPYPGYEEYGFGAICEEGHIYVPEKISVLSPEQIDKIIEKQEEEIRRRANLYRQGHPLPSMFGRTVLLVDDGIATGVTLIPAIRLCRAKGAAKIVIAVPVAGRHYNQHLHEADEIRILTQPSEFYGVGQAYIDFGQLTDEKVVSLIRRSKLENETNV